MSRIYIFFLSLSFCTSCDLKDAQLLGEITESRDSLKNQYAPDKRVAIFQIDLSLDQGKLILSGISDQPEALNTLIESVEKSGFDFENQITSLPDSSVGDLGFGIINNSVGNIRSEPRHSAELATQAVLGTEVKVLQLREEWSLIQTPDGYISWIDHGGVHLMNETEIYQWRNNEKVIVIANSASVFLKDRIIGDAVLGSIMELSGQTSEKYLVKYPDGRIGEIAKEMSKPLKEWYAELSPSGDLLEKYAMDLVGSPYLWGGTSTKGMDCSGFTKTVYFMNGMVIPRDASQQIHAGRSVDNESIFQGLEKGDLVFFGKSATDSTRQKVTHVGLWLGDQEFIHSSMRVRISSIDPESEYYDDMNVKRYLGARRYLGVQDEEIKAL